MNDFDFDKPYGASPSSWLATGAGIVANGLLVLGVTLLFVSAVSVLWGWYFFGIFNCVLLLAKAIDDRVLLRQLLQGQKYWRKGERIYLIYFTGLVTVGLIVNLAFVVLYLLGSYEPPFGNIPFG